MTIDATGVYQIPQADYLADPVKGGSLSSSGARRLLPPSCPALFRHWQDNPEPPTDAMELGTVAHAAVLEGTFDRVVVVYADDWRTKAAKEERDDARAMGFVPLLEKDFETVRAMAAELRHGSGALAPILFDDGAPEMTLVWESGSGQLLRARLDWLPNVVEGQRMILADYKTCISAEPRAIARAVANYGLHQQAAFYVDGIKALGLDDDPAFLFVFQEKTAPFLVTVVELDAEAMALGRARNVQAIELFERCSAAGVWPGYSTDVKTISLPKWATYQQEEDLS